MKIKNKIITVIGMAAITLMAITGCANGKIFSGTQAPSATERAFYDVQTNYVTQVETVTNTVATTNIVTMEETNTVTVNNTNTQITLVPVQVTNVTTQVNVITTTNQQPVYQLTANGNAATVEQSTAAIGNSIAPGAGTLAGLGLSALIGFWGWLRSYKTGSQQTVAANALSQEVETLLEFVQALPKGEAYTTAIQAWLQQHQVQTGSASTILNILENEVSNPDAKAAVASILTSLNTLGTTVPATVPPNAPASKLVGAS
jgi:hypothetical protein